MDNELSAVLAQYPPECRPRRTRALGSAGGFSGAQFWQLETERGTLCLRRWPREHPDRQQLELIHDVLRRVYRGGLVVVPVPLSTVSGHSYVHSLDHFWELAPWMPGEANYWQQPNPTRLVTAMSTLARFHELAAERTIAGPSPGIGQRLEQLDKLAGGGAARAAGRLSAVDWPELADRAMRLFPLFAVVAPRARQLLVSARHLRVSIQPCLRDIWHDHVLFADDELTGVIDFGALRNESVSGDVARLLGSLVGDEPDGWRDGLSAYQAVRTLSESELQLVEAFDRSTVLLAGMNWLRWIYVEGRQFADRNKVLIRLDRILQRLGHLATSIGEP